MAAAVLASLSGGGAQADMVSAPQHWTSTMPETHRTRVLIIGSGPAGYTAAIYAARASLSPILVAGLQPGGQLTITTDVENYPGFADVIQGPWLMEQMAAQAEHVGTRIVHDLITQVDFSARPFRCVADSGDVFLADCGDHRHRRAGALARPRVGAAAAGPRRVGLRHLRRVLLPRQGGGGGRRRQHRGRGGAVPDPPRRQRHADPPPRRAAGGEDPAGPAVRPPQDPGGLGQRRRGDRGRRHARGGHRRPAAQREDRRR